MWQQVRRILRRLLEVVFSYLQIVFHRHGHPRRFLLHQQQLQMLQIDV